MDCGQGYSATNLKAQASLPTHGRIHCNAIQGPWSFCCNLWLHIQGNASATSIVEPRYPCYFSPKFHAEFGVAEEGSDSPRVGLNRDSAVSLAEVEAMLVKCGAVRMTDTVA